MRKPRLCFRRKADGKGAADTHNRSGMFLEYFKIKIWYENQTDNNHCSYDIGSSSFGGLLRRD